MILNKIPVAAEVTDIVEELRKQLAENGINLLGVVRDTPDNLMVACPYHKGGQEKRPSAGIKKSDGTFHCFACDATHSLQEMVSFCLGNNDDITGAKGWSWILQHFGTVSVETRKPLKLDFERHHTSKPVQKAVSEEELDSYRVYHPYMWKRKLTPEIVERFDIGYDSHTRCITFPVREIHGTTLFVARRSVESKFFNYPAGAEKPVYGLYELSCLDKYPSEVIICESMLDALACWVYGKPAVALNGLGNDLQFRQLNEMPCRKFILATDSDQRGMEARGRIRKNLRGKLVSEYILPPGRKDMNDLSKEEFDNLKEVW